MNKPNGGTYALYEDAAYPLSLHLQKGYTGNNPTPQQERYNAAMSSAWQAVEWSFKDVMTYFPYGDMKRQQKVGQQAVGLHYRVSVLLVNILTCVKRGNQGSDHIQLSPPTLQEYLH